MAKEASSAAPATPKVPQPQQAKDVPRRTKKGGERLSLAGALRLSVVIHAAEEGGYWAEVPALRGCVSEGESLEEVIVNIREAARGWLEAAAEQNPPEADPDALVVELSL
jgi:predicted RNase H-like HicB family nuclease